MTVRELIEMLNNVPNKDMVVYIGYEGCCISKAETVMETNIGTSEVFVIYED